MHVLTSGWEHCCACASPALSARKAGKEKQATAAQIGARMSRRTIPELTLWLHWEKNVRFMSILLGAGPPAEASAGKGPPGGRGVHGPPPERGGSRLSEAAPLLLASGSPRRREILIQLGVP